MILIILGVAIGAGWQSLVAYINIACYYLVGLPAGILLGFKFGLGAMVIFWKFFRQNALLIKFELGLLVYDVFATLIFHCREFGEG